MKQHNSIRHLQPLLLLLTFLTGDCVVSRVGENAMQAGSIDCYADFSQIKDFFTAIP